MLSGIAPSKLTNTVDSLFSPLPPTIIQETSYFREEQQQILAFGIEGTLKMKVVLAAL